MNTRIFVKKKEAYRVEADSLGHELKTSLNLNGLSGVTLYNTYDVFNADAHDIDLLRRRVLSEIVTDEVDDALDLEGKTYVAYECLPGQYDQRADSAQQCLMLLNNKSDVVIKSGAYRHPGRGSQRCAAGGSQALSDQPGGDAREGSQRARQ